MRGTRCTPALLQLKVAILGDDKSIEDKPPTAGRKAADQTCESKGVSTCDRQQSGGSCAAGMAYASGMAHASGVAHASGMEAQVSDGSRSCGLGLLLLLTQPVGASPL